MVIDFNRPNGPAGPGASRSNQIQGSERPTATQPSDNAVSSQETGAAAGEPVQLSPEAQRLQQATEQLSQQPVVDQARVERIRQAISDGTYEIDPKRLAAKLTAFESQQ
ncbi:flagellar biosynthesis anti-sigma factor FlgM [Stutzerimonas balearica]|jgi:negative regulator of flagellin synthesis FlgM|uniref:Negative regulator of flagellin synthesis n=1 Tax=Stutzerimonas balearica DSM 6083 TaxID=1123016 RepID=A0A8D3Y028_9GAMM|nr:flagellar biosynthesis anti-sigma factor FlgM [Stutzerimonas balearica]KIL05003.1 flagellar biosynthesis anti-sigma factor FlgM [Stutzerimonas stutzeri]AJE14763.1 flagellar biosynthesis anti-sigma factor FlgM [Stutzerimonas balearica DSM 6083]MCZ4128139.1 flagellar biosynthesis anti-sigma factor FlgM [Stutzerimonas balearica]OMG66177.1 flagellar biosynthesis anti-sigma factor FlgM [Stutzerimonas balearica]SDM36220.1 anti-sigma-28 factor, FlgM family [Stutzerimonas balearica DSM 6083]